MAAVPSDPPAGMAVDSDAEMPDPMDPPSLEMSPNSFNVVASAVQSSGLYANSEEN